MQDYIDFDEFVKDLKLELDENDNSRMAAKISKYKQHISSVDAKLEEKRLHVRKLKVNVKNYYQALTNLMDAEYLIAESLAKFNLSNIDEEITSALVLFPEIFKEMAKQKYATLLLINNLLYYPLQAYLQKDSKLIAEHRKNVEDAYKDHRNKGSKHDKEQKKKNDIVLYRPENAETEGSRRLIEYYICDYIMKFEEMNGKTCIGMLQSLIEYTDTWQNNMKSCVNTIDGLKTVFEYWTKKGLATHKNIIEEKRKDILQLQTKLKNFLPSLEKHDSVKSEYKLHGAETDKDYGSFKAGYIQKKSEGLRKAWQKRYCVVGDGFIRLSHGPNEPCTANLSLLTSQPKYINNSEKDLKKYAFLLISSNRKFYFATETEAETKAWVSVISNCREIELKKAFEEGGKKDGNDNSTAKNAVELLKNQVRKLVGNNLCADCFTEDPEWVSTNLGILVCIECSGIHREMGVRVSRIRSITIDNINVSELFLAGSIGNYAMNEVMDPFPETHTIISRTSTMDQRRIYLNEKYVERKYMNSSSIPIDDFSLHSLLTYDLSTILYLYMNGFDFLNQNDNPEKNTFLHLLVSQKKENYLCVVEFLVQNIPKILNEKNSIGNIPLHLALINQNINCSKILIRAGSDLYINNDAGISANDIIFSSKDPIFYPIRESIANKRTNRLQVDINVIMEQVGFSEEADQESILPKLSSPTTRSSHRFSNPNVALDEYSKNIKATHRSSEIRDFSPSFILTSTSLSSETRSSEKINKGKNDSPSEYQLEALTNDTKLNDDLFDKNNLRNDKATANGSRKSPVPSSSSSSSHHRSSLSFAVFQNKFSKINVSGSKSLFKSSDSKKSLKHKGLISSLAVDVSTNSASDGSSKQDFLTAYPCQSVKPKYQVIAVKRFIPSVNTSEMLCLDVGEQLVVTIENEDSEYYYGYKLENEDVCGLFPSDYVHIIKRL